MFGIEFNDNLHGYSVIALYAQNHIAFVLAYDPGNDMPYATWKVCGHGCFLDCQVFSNLISAHDYLNDQLNQVNGKKRRLKERSLHQNISRKREKPMNLFLLRLPTPQDIQTMHQNLSEEQYQKLLAPAFSSNFHIKDTNIYPWKEKVGFRPVLEAAIDTELNIIRDGTFIQMECPVIEGIPYLQDVQPVNWIKCGNFLIANQAITDDIPYDDLISAGLLSGIPLRAPFDQAVFNYFYLQNTYHPDS